MTLFKITLLLSVPALAQKTEQGIPVTDPLVLAKCSGCHHKDDKGNLTRISWERTTPEGWEEVIKRMIRLNGLTLKPDEARAIVKSLSTSHGLSPEEAKPVMYIAERRTIDEATPNDAVRQACASCHPIGRARSWRRSKEEWDLLVSMHRGYFTVAEQSFRGSGGREGRQVEGSRPAVEQAVEYLAKDFGLTSPEWAAWRARMRTPKLAGRWLIDAYQRGRGKIVGEMQIEPGPSEDEFTASVKLTYTKDGSSVTKSSKSVVYSGYSWRGKTPDWREVMWVSPDQSEMSGRWFWGAYDEFGIDVKMRRGSEAVSMTGVDVSMLKIGSTAQRVRIFGDNFSKLSAADIDFGSGVAVRRVVEQSSQQATVEVDVDAKAIAGKRDVSVRRAVAGNAIAVYKEIDHIKVAPDTALARLGGVDYPKGFQQFEAIAYDHEVELGAVDAEWSVEEFYSVYGDDDKEFVGTLSAKGLFTPNVEGPNPKRRFSRNNYGDVWVVAKYKGLIAKSYLVVAVPLYVRWDQPEVAQ
jgi:quinohemoprotein amine dehydrogenase